MTERTDRIKLAADEPRCPALKGCCVKSKCVRIQATVPPGGRMYDYSLDCTGGGSALCEGYLPAHMAMQLATRPAAKPAKLSIGGL